MADNVGGKKATQVDTGQSVQQKKGLKSSDASVYKSSDEVTRESKKSGLTSVFKSSDECFEYRCDPCKRVGDNVEAEGFCMDCGEYLCSTCFRSHSRNKVCKHHTLLGKDDMPRKSTALCNPCKMFGDEFKAVGYCKDCCAFLCSECFMSHPRNKASRHHVLVKNEEMIENVDQMASSSIAGLIINKGTTDEKKTSDEYTYVRDINVKSDTDDQKCYIVDMTLVSKNQLVLCDKDNKCLKLVDTDKNIIKDVLALQHKTYGITAISNDQIAVVLADIYQIKIVSARGKLTLERTIRTDGCCLNVTMINKHLYVSFLEPVKFQIQQPTGAIIKTIKPDDEVLKHCTYPRYIAVSSDESVIYVSDLQTNKVLSLDINGNMIALYQEELDLPVGIVISPSGSVYVCNRRQHVVYKMKSDLSEAVVILGKGDGLMSPYAICLDTDNQLLYISSGCGYARFLNFCKVFK